MTQQMTVYVDGREEQREIACYLRVEGNPESPWFSAAVPVLYAGEGYVHTVSGQCLIFSAADV